MDLLASLHLDGELPEQQTRLSHLDESTLADNPKLKLGFNACCVCAKSDPSVECRACHRVKYCSSACREKDATLSPENEEEAAMGHSSVVCALLRLCDADEEAEDAVSTAQVDESAKDRVQSEYESYPATLANVLLDGPCFKVMLARSVYSETKELVIHVVGASVEAELWGRKDVFDRVWDAYADALQELAEQNGLKVIRLAMIGPELPKQSMTTERTISVSSRNDSASCQLLISTHKHKYTSRLFEKDVLSKPDVLCFFNPGFTCPDYSWDKTISCLDYGTSFIITTNTEMEGIGDCQFLLEQELLPSLPPVAAAIIGSDLVDENSEVMFGENPFVGMRVRQSGTMANDLYVKNRWLLAGVFAKPVIAPSKDAKTSDADAEESEEERPAKRSKKSQNNKRSNPALI